MMKRTFYFPGGVLMLLGLFLLAGCQSKHVVNHELAIGFNGQYGQVEIGGKYAGLEFHNSWPLPARISFYYPVANSIDKSTDYWKRYESHPFLVTVRTDEAEYSLNEEPFDYRYTPYYASFEKAYNDFTATVQYEFCNDLPVTVFTLRIKNTALTEKEFNIHSSLETSLKTSHTFALKNIARLGFTPDSTTAWYCYDDIGTDSTCIFIANAGAKPLPQIIENDSLVRFIPPIVNFHYFKKLKPGAELEIVQLIGSCRQAEQMQIIKQSFKNWRLETQSNAARINDYALHKGAFTLPDSSLLQTNRWAKAILMSNIHYLDGRYVPMPCPAEYNFFFTHDLLLTGFGAMMYDTEWLKNGYQFLHSLTQADSILPHAYYWKDSRFATEFCASDNWNHLWFIISTSAYLKHSGDKETVALLFPTIQKSLRMMLTNKGQDDLMYAKRPDWWDIGDMYGARAYITILMSRALQDYVYTANQLGRTEEDLAEYLALAQNMKAALAENLWDDQAGFLMNMLNDKVRDNHYYSGSLLSVVYDAIQDKQKDRLLETARRVLLDENLGIRNAMPPDYHKLGDVYKFQGMEMGEPYYYFNGGIWSQGIGWYAQALLAVGRADDAEQVLKKYLTLDGITNSPNGHPSFFEYRFSDPAAVNYGEIDKPTFLWAGGFYLNILYQLAGVRDNPWNISFSGYMPKDFDKLEYDVNLYGQLCRVNINGNGQYFSSILVDGKPCLSTVFCKPAREIRFERGVPNRPYVAYVDGVIEDVQYSDLDKSLKVKISGIAGQECRITLVTPFLTGAFEINNEKITGSPEIKQDGQVYLITVHPVLDKVNSEIVFYFQE